MSCSNGGRPVISEKKCKCESVSAGTFSDIETGIRIV